MRRVHAFRRLSTWLALGGLAFALGGCNLSDRQVTQIIQSVITTGLNSAVNAAIGALVPQQEA